MVGGAAIDRTPRFLKEFAIRTFGQNDKLVLLSGVLATIAVLSVLIGVLAGYRRRAGLVAVSMLGLVAAVAATTRPTARWYDVGPSLLAAVVGVLALARLLDAFGVGDDAEPCRAGRACRPGRAARRAGRRRRGPRWPWRPDSGGRSLLNARNDVSASPAPPGAAEAVVALARAAGRRHAGRLPDQPLLHRAA